MCRDSFIERKSVQLRATEVSKINGERKIDLQRFLQISNQISNCWTPHTQFSTDLCIKNKNICRASNTCNLPQFDQVPFHSPPPSWHLRRNVSTIPPNASHCVAPLLLRLPPPSAPPLSPSGLVLSSTCFPLDVLPVAWFCLL